MASRKIGIDNQIVVFSLPFSIIQMSVMEDQIAIQEILGKVGVAMDLTEEWVKVEGYLHSHGQYA